MKKLLIFSFVMMLFANVIVAEECNSAEMRNVRPLLSHISFNLQNRQHRSRLEGFAQGTLVKIENGYVAIETLSSGDIVEGKNGNQKIVCAQKRFGPGRVALSINDQYMCVAPYQQFCMADSSWKFACDLMVIICSMKAVYKQ